MCQAAVSLISKALHEVDNAESLLKIKNLIALFMQTMNVGGLSFLYFEIPVTMYLTFYGQTWNFPVGVFDDFLLILFERYSELLKKRFSDDFQEVRHTPEKLLDAN